MSFPSGHLGGQFIHSVSVAYALVCLKKVKEEIGELAISAVPVFLPGWPTCGAQLQAKRS